VWQLLENAVNVHHVDFSFLKLFFKF
jgi:hypothetical protein